MLYFHFAEMAGKLHARSSWRNSDGFLNLPNLDFKRNHGTDTANEMNVT